MGLRFELALHQPLFTLVREHGLHCCTIQCAPRSLSTVFPNISSSYCVQVSVPFIEHGQEPECQHSPGNGALSSALPPSLPSLFSAHRSKQLLKETHISSRHSSAEAALFWICKVSFVLSLYVIYRTLQLCVGI